MRRLRERLTYANVVSSLALFLVIAGGTAYAANTIRTGDIVDNEVFATDVRDDTLAFGGLLHQDLRPGSVRSSEVANNSLGGIDINESSFDSNLRTPGLIRSGSETGTGNAPDVTVGPGYQGVVVRKINSTTTTLGSIVARTDTLRLVRDGTTGGLNLEWDANPGKIQLVCKGYAATGGDLTTVITQDNPSTSGSTDVSSNAMMLDCTFGNSFNNRHITSVHMTRYPGDNYWVGTLTSTYNQ